MIRSCAQEPTSMGNALLNLAAEFLRVRRPMGRADLLTNILNAAVQLAVTALKA
jgi:hypothetical protein